MASSTFLSFVKELYPRLTWISSVNSKSIKSRPVNEEILSFIMIFWKIVCIKAHFIPGCFYEIAGDENFLMSINMRDCEFQIIQWFVTDMWGQRSKVDMENWYHS